MAGSRSGVPSLKDSLLKDSSPPIMVYTTIASTVVRNGDGKGGGLATTADLLRYKEPFCHSSDLCLAKKKGEYTPPPPPPPLSQFHAHGVMEQKNVKPDYYNYYY
jgi:hypothetical protein